MTIEELVSTRDTVERVCDDLNRGAKALAAAMQAVMEATGKPPVSEVANLRSEVYKYIQEAEAARRQLSEYNRLITGIMRQSTLEWPPTCVLKGEQ